jgi:uncharacterized OB-fold protein
MTNSTQSKCKKCRSYFVEGDALCSHCCEPKEEEKEEEKTVENDSSPLPTEIKS